MPTLGERIRKLRKEKNLTLAALAGDTLTKGMLSLIENNKANPSMDSLNYIAKQLEVDPAELLEEVSSRELTELANKVEKLFNSTEQTIEKICEEVIFLINPYIDRLNNSYPSAKLLDFYGRAMYFSKVEGWELYTDRAATLYEELYIAQRRVKIAIFRSFVHTTAYQYNSAIETLQKERAIIEKRFTVLDPMARLDLDYTEASTLFSIGNAERALEIIYNSIQFSIEQGILYRMEALYRLSAFYMMMTGDNEKFLYYIKKLELYDELVENEDIFAPVQYIKIHYLTTYQYAFEEALSLLERYDYAKHPIRLQFYNLEKGKALLGLKKYDEALHFLKEATFSDPLIHPFDLSLQYTGDSYLALCYQALGDKQQAFKHAKIAYNRIAILPATPYKDFIIETYEKIRSS